MIKCPICSGNDEREWKECRKLKETVCMKCCRKCEYYMYEETLYRAFCRYGENEDKMKNTLNDLNEYLFDALDALTNDCLNEEELDKEIKRAEAVQKVAKTIIDNGNLALQAKKHMDEYGNGDKIKLTMLGVSEE